jgi:hypothetical protein
MATTKRVVAAPFNELPIKTAKLASLCEKLHLAGRKLSELGEDLP